MTDLDTSDDAEAVATPPDWHILIYEVFNPDYSVGVACDRAGMIVKNGEFVDMVQEFARDPEELRRLGDATAPPALLPVRGPREIPNGRLRSNPGMARRPIRTGCSPVDTSSSAKSAIPKWVTGETLPVTTRQSPRMRSRQQMVMAARRCGGRFRRREADASNLECGLRLGAMSGHHRRDLGSNLLRPLRIRELGQ